MRCKQIVIGTFASVAGLLGYSTILPAAPLEATVQAGEDHCISDESTVELLEVNYTGVTLKVSGACSGDTGATPKGMESFTHFETVDEGTTNVRIDLARGAIVTLPLTVTVGASELTGKEPKRIGTTAYYDAPASGTVPEAGGTDYFDYTFKDANGTVTKTVSIPIKWVDPKIVTGDCEGSSTVICKGLLPDWPAGFTARRFIDKDHTHVWYFDYDAEINEGGSFVLFDGGYKAVSVSLNANDFSGSYPCNITQKSPQASLDYAPSGEDGFWECPLEDGRRYYLNIKSTLTAADLYSLVVR